MDPTVIERSLTKIRDVDLKIMSELDDKSLLSFCQVSKYGNQLCKNETFWRNRLSHKYGEEILSFKSPERTYRDFYLNIVYYTNKYPNNIFASAQVTLLDGVKNVDLFNYFKSLLPENELPLLYTITFKYASQRGNRELINYLISEGVTNWEVGFLGAVKGSQLNLIQYFLNKVKESGKLDEYDYEDLITEGIEISKKMNDNKVVEYLQSLLTGI